MTPMDNDKLAEVPMPAYSITFEDQRDFLRFASLLIGAVYTHAPDALARFQNNSLLGERTWGRVHATLAAAPAPAAVTVDSAALAEEAWRAWADKRGWLLDTAHNRNIFLAGFAAGAAVPDAPAEPVATDVECWERGQPDSIDRAMSVEARPQPTRCPLCNYQHGHAIGCKNNPVDIALNSCVSAAPAPAAGTLTAREVWKQAAALCEASEELPDPPEGQGAHAEGFARGRRFEARGIRKALGAWLWEAERAAPATSQASEPGALRAALERIERWFGEFPETGQTWGDGTPVSYGAAYGSNGERDYMRKVARDALAAAPEAPGTQGGDAVAITQEQARTLWHWCGAEVHNRTTAFEWFFAGIVAAEHWHAPRLRPVAPEAPAQPGLAVETWPGQLALLRNNMQDWHSRAVRLGADGVATLIDAAEVAHRRGMLTCVDGGADWKPPLEFADPVPPLGQHDPESEAAQPVQGEPLAWRWVFVDEHGLEGLTSLPPSQWNARSRNSRTSVTPVFTTTPARKRVTEAEERSAFEAEQVRQVMEYSKGRHHPHLDRTGDGYQNPLVHAAWQGWKARALYAHVGVEVGS